MRRYLLLTGLCLLLPTRLFGFDAELWTNFPNMNHVTSLAEGEIEMFVATTGGIRRYDRFYDRWLPPLTTRDGLPDNRVLRLAYEPDTGDLWFETASGKGRWLTRLETISAFAGDPPRSHSRPGIPQLIMPFGYHLQGGWIRGPRRVYEITDTLLDSWRVLWIGTWGLGVGRADLRDERLAFRRFGPIAENVTAIARDGDAYWFGGDDTYSAPAPGITRYTPSSQTWDYFEAEDIIGLEDARIGVILPDSADVWFGSDEGLVRFERETDAWLTYRVDRSYVSRVTALARDSDRLWIGTSTGLAVFDLAADTIRAVDGSERFAINDLAKGSNHVWAATDHGLFRCPRGEATWRRVESASGLTERPTAAVAAAEGSVWAVLDAPPALLGSTGDHKEWQHYPLSEAGGSRRIGLAADTVHAWVGTDLGAFRFDTHSESWQRLTPFDGLLNNRVQAVLLDGDYVWFGTADGVSRFHWARAFF